MPRAAGFFRGKLKGGFEDWFLSNGCGLSRPDPPPRDKDPGPESASPKAALPLVHSGMSPSLEEALPAVPIDSGGERRRTP